MLDHGLHALLNKQHKRNTTMKNLKAWNNKTLRLLILLTGVFLMGAEGCDEDTTGTCEEGFEWVEGIGCV